MSALVTLPGDIPGLIRPGVRTRVSATGTRAMFVVPCQHKPRSWWVLFEEDEGSGLLADVGDLVFDLFGLDLSEPDSRDIAARWMAERLGLEVGLTAPSFHFNPHAGAWFIVAGRREFSFVPSGVGDRIVPNLPLDPAQGIEAMRLCVLHLAGRLP